MGKKTTKTTSTSSPPSWAVGPLSSGMNDILSNYNANQGGLQALQSGLTGSTIPGLQSLIGSAGQQLAPGQSYIGQTLASNPGLANPANGQLTSYANGNYLNTNNPAVQALANFAGQQAGNQINSAFSAAGRTGSGNNVMDTARGVTQAELAPMLQNNQFEQGLQQQALGQLSSNYNTGMGIQSSAASMLPGYYGSQFSGYQPLLGATQLAGQLPYYGSSSLTGLGALAGNYGTTTNQQPNTLLPGILGAGLAGWASGGFALPSDERAKENIEQVGILPNGLGLYEFDYKPELKIEGRYRGVMAQEVERVMPWMLGPEIGGFKTVRYIPERVA